MQNYLDAFAATIGPDEPVALVLDQAGWHGAKSLKVPTCITLVSLPPRLPEFNPIERRWLFLKQKCLSFRVLDDYAAIEEVICKAWQKLIADPGPPDHPPAHLPGSSIASGINGASITRCSKANSKASGCMSIRPAIGRGSSSFGRGTASAARPRSE
jgi:hypothetical protein